jgi:hypothetical protein
MASPYTPLDATPGSPVATAYCTAARATVLLQDHLALDAWYTQSPEEGQTLYARRDASLITATRRMDAQIGWYGVPTFPDQALAWPQTGQVDRYGRPIDSTTIPLAIEQACAFWALALMGATAAGAVSTNDALQIKSKKIGDTTITYQDISGATQATVTSPEAMPVEVRELLRPYGMVPGFGMIPVLRT